MRFDDSVGRVSGFGSGVLYQQESSPNVTFLRLLGLRQYELIRNCLALKLLISAPNLKTSFIVIIMAKLFRTHFTKNMIWRALMGSIRLSSNTGSRITKDTAFIQHVDDWEPHIPKWWCLGINNISFEVHTSAQVEVISGTVGEFVND